MTTTAPIRMLSKKIISNEKLDLWYLPTYRSNSTCICIIYRWGLKKIYYKHHDDEDLMKLITKMNI